MVTITPSVKPLWATTNPGYIVALAASQTMKRFPEAEANGKGLPYEPLVSFLYKAEHRSPLEHAVLCMQVNGVSRAFMAQITRHRLASYTCSSQHYQTYSKYPVIQQGYSERMEMAMDDALAAYDEALKMGMPKDQARMVLPEAMTVNMIITANAREWAEIMHQRLCQRNTAETLTVARAMRKVLYDWFPQLFAHVGPQCSEGMCMQGKMSCRKNTVQGTLA